MSRRDYRLRIYNAGSTSLSTANVDFTLDGSRLRDPITIRAPLIIPHEGRTEAQPWDVHVSDIGSTFTAQLADSSGRMDLLGRIALAQTRTDSTTWVNQGTGRISDVYLDDTVADYRIVIEDERTQETGTLIFNSTNTTHLHPGGPAVAYGPFRVGPKGTVRIQRQGQAAGTTNMYRAIFVPAYTPMSDATIGRIQSDLVPNPELSTRGNFQYTRLRIGNTDYPIVSFGSVTSTAQTGWDTPSVWFTDELWDMFRDGQPMAVWIGSPSTAFSVGTEYSSAYLHRYSGPPTPEAPLHIGGALGLHPMQVLKNVYDRAYSLSSNTPAIRYSTAAFSTGSTGLLGIPMPNVRFRITEPQPMRQWLEDHIYRPFMVVPTINANGEIAPVSLKLPASTAGITTTLTGANLRAPHPSWSHPLRNAITVLQVEHEQESVIRVRQQDPVPPDTAADFLKTQMVKTEVPHDRVNTLGRRVHVLKAIGIKTDMPTGEAAPVGFDPNYQSYDVKRYVAYIQRDYFDRFGDGPIVGDLHALSTAESVIPGQYVKITLGTYPNPSNGARTGSRFVQILGKSLTPFGPEFQYLDAGPASQPVSAPTVTLSSSVTDPKHSVRVTIGSVVAGGGFNLEIAHSATTAHPAANSQLWQAWQTTGRTSSGVFRVGQRPSGTKVWARAHNTKVGRFGSSWVYSSDGKTTQTITGPSSLTGSSVTAGTILATWTPGNDGYKTVMHIDTSTAASFSTANQVSVIPSGSDRFRFEGLDSTTKYLIGARHVDPYGGFSTAAKASVTTTTVTRTAPDMLGIHILRAVVI